MFIDLPNWQYLEAFQTHFSGLTNYYITTMHIHVCTPSESSLIGLVSRSFCNGLMNVFNPPILVFNADGDNKVKGDSSSSNPECLFVHL
jgi:hypothetical protein